jgi:hypothetical protein
VHKADNLPPSCAVVTKSGNLNFLGHSRPVMGLLYIKTKIHPPPPPIITLSETV